MWYSLLFMGLLLSLQAEAFRLPFRPMEQIRYRSGACETDLERVSYALLKEKTYTGCLEKALEGLQRKGSPLSRQFERTYNLKNRDYQMNYDSSLKRVLMREILQRLGQEDSISTFLDQPLRITEEGEAEFIRTLNQFCRHNKEMNDPYGQERVKRIISGVEVLDIHRLFEGFRRTLRVAESLEYKDPQIIKGLKRFRSRFLIVLNQMILLKKALAGMPLREGIILEDEMRKITLRTEWIEAYHKLKTHALMSDACQEDKKVCTQAFEEMDNLASIIQSFDDLKNACWTKRRPRQNII